LRRTRYTASSRLASDEKSVATYESLLWDRALEAVSKLSGVAAGESNFTAVSDSKQGNPVREGFDTYDPSPQA
jgi:hypothetical protein